MIYIRVDMNEIIATGHMMRCIAIADAVRELGEDTTFLLADTQAVELLEIRNYNYIVLDSQWNDMNRECEKIKDLVKLHSIKCILVDSYQVTDVYLRELSSVTKTIYLDDICSFSYPVNGIICYANYYDKFSYEEKCPDAKLYLGTEYAPLRKEFMECPEKYICEKVGKLLLLSGGADPFHFLYRIMDVLEVESYERIDIICGKYNEDYQCIKEKCAEKERVYVHKAVSDMKKYLEQADLVVSAGGTTLYEICAVGTPAISYALADNQLNNVEQFHKEGVIEYAGDIRYDDVINNVRSLIDFYFTNHELRKEKSRKMRRIVDGKGARRIAKILISESNEE